MLIWKERSGSNDKLQPTVLRFNVFSVLENGLKIFKNQNQYYDFLETQTINNTVTVLKQVKHFNYRSYHFTTAYENKFIVYTRICGMIINSFFKNKEQRKIQLKL